MKMNITITTTKEARRKEAEQTKNANPSSVAAKYPELLVLWDWEKNKENGIDPYQLAASSDAQSWWKCTNHPHSYHVRTSNKTYNNQGCPICANRQVLLGFNDLPTKAPSALVEWDYSLNELKPEQYTYASHHKAYWICREHNESWSSEIRLYVKGVRGCPTCQKDKMHVALSKPKKGGTYLSVGYPEVAAEWAYELNGTLTPDIVPSGSGKVVWWRCSKCSYVWESSVYNRTGAHQSGCPDCAKWTTGLKNSHPRPKASLADLHPELVKEWHPTKNGDLTPYNIAGKSNKNVWWKCSTCGYEYKSQPCNRSVAVTGCPKCINKHRSEVVSKPKQGQSLGELYPELASEWHDTKNGNVSPFDVAKRSNTKYWWKCRYGHEWQAAPSNRVGESSGCPTCSKYRRTSFPEKAVYYYLSQVMSDACENAHPFAGKNKSYEVDIWIPSVNTAIEYDGEIWHRNKEKDVIKNRICADNGIRLIRIRESGCPVLEDKTSTIITRDDCRSFASLNKAIEECLKELGCKIDVDVDRDQDAIMLLLDRRYKHSSIVVTHPDVADEWDYELNGELTPQMFTHGSAKKAWWICPQCGNSYKTRISHRCDGHGCKPCATKRAWELRKKHDFDKT